MQTAGTARQHVILSGFSQTKCLTGTHYSEPKIRCEDMSHMTSGGRRGGRLAVYIGEGMYWAEGFVAESLAIVVVIGRRRSRVDQGFDEPLMNLC